MPELNLPDDLTAMEIAAIPGITKWLEQQIPTLRYKTARDGVGVAVVLLERRAKEGPARPKP